VIVEVEVEKVTVEVVAPATGVLSSILALQGDEVRVDETIAVITEDGAS
jgi:2-oxoglutarate dehydrogenase E2 component (dihydrolipoamide succinyltransferase)